ncbi:MAG: CaiB/BaiF CoA transferase family protein [Candidatus Hodarchaeales archaeon]|jgi:crotonobetainyl-CoA:carnitine CoA-transferase CaiB-like acyl-CoA transferase
MPLRSVLEGIRVLDLTTNLPGPLATQMLGDFGADVIKVESLIGDPVRYYPPFIDQESQLNLLLNRNKRSIALDLKQKEGLAIFNKLVEACDIVIVGFRPSTVRKLNIEFTTLSKINPKLIYCQLTGYGSTDDRVGHDLNYIGEVGILNLTGPQEKPVVPGVPIADIGGGSLPTVITILGALLKRKYKPQYFDISMTDHLLPWLSVVAAEYLAGLGEPERALHALSGYVSWYGVYQTKDNEFITFAPIESKFWRNFCNALDRKDLLNKQHDLEFCEEELPKIFLSRTTNEWNDLFTQFDIPGGEVHSLEYVFRKKGRLTKIKHPELGQIQLIASPYLKSDISCKPRVAPTLGEHSEEILAEIGLREDIKRFIEKGIIKTSNSS